ncbi:SusC/RagA family TonB-linked outer membrane protein [Mucilaginibacter sp.]|jgi:TonB-linked SusC/RagA family outer membrane protein|uniref:SusC/RagA family TonB-linked outer membrane protein n=1 Tax=Mucilaginibacter sp. TaxID=1882438 RepID=UPI00356A0856
MRKTITKLLRLTFTLCALIMGIGMAGYAQTTQPFTVRGIVVDEKGNTVPGASVGVAGTSLGTVAAGDGKFSITLTRPSTLNISFLGMAPKSVVVTSATDNLKITLSQSGRDLAEVIVVGYGTQKKSDVTGSVTSVPKQRLSQLPVTNVLQAIEGSVAGVSVTTTSSVPGSQPAALIRGQNSITATSGPYVVVDGIPLSKTGGSLNDINPNDILSVEVLKDASATAIYGTNGSNGVILITTKRGTVGKPVIRYNGYAGVEDLANILQPRSGAEYVQKYADWLSQTGQKQTNPVPNFGELANYNAGKTTNWIKETTQQGVIQDHNLSISGGSPDVRYFISGDYLNQKGTIKGYNYKRISLRSNLDINVTSFLTIGTSTFITSNNYDGGRANLLLATAMSPYGNLYNADGTYAIYPMNPEQLYVNPLLGLNTTRLSRSTNINGNGYAEIKFPGVLSGLKYRLNAGYTFFPERSASYTGRIANDLNGTASNFAANTNSYTLENILTYARDINKHHFDFTGLYSSQERKYFSTTAGAVGFVNDELGPYNLGAGATQTSASYRDRYGINSQMARINYSYDSRYLLTLTARRDGSSVFGANTDKYGVFPSAALGWNIGNESFLKDSKIVDNLKLRASYGQTGNEAVSVYRTITTDGTARSPFNGISTIGVLPTNLGNSNLKWENTKTANLGVDFSLFKGRIAGTVDAYQNKTNGLLLSRSLPIITGYNNVLENIGRTSNRGIEVTINTRNIQGRDFKWETAVVFSANKNKIVDLYGDGKDDLGNRWFIGKPIGVVYDYKMTGIWQTGQDASTQDPGAKPGDLKFADLNGDGKITADGDRTILGQSTPKWTGGLTNTFHYKNFNLNVFIQTAQGMLKNNPDLNYGDETGRRNTPVAVSYWTPTNGNNTRPALSYNNTRGYGYASDASYTRIKDVTLSYVFGPSVLEKLNLGSMTIYASGRNLHTFTNWIGWDPENNYSTRGSGDWTNNYPLTRTFILGVNVSLR